MSVTLLSQNSISNQSESRGQQKMINLNYKACESTRDSGYDCSSEWSTAVVLKWFWGPKLCIQHHVAIQRSTKIIYTAQNGFMLSITNNSIHKTYRGQHKPCLSLIQQNPYLRLSYFLLPLIVLLIIINFRRNSCHTTYQYWLVAFSVLSTSHHNRPATC